MLSRNIVRADFRRAADALACHGHAINHDRSTCAAQEIVFFEQGEPMIDGDTGDLKARVSSSACPGQT